MRRVKKSLLWGLRCLSRKVVIRTRGVKKSLYGWCNIGDFEPPQMIKNVGILFERCWNMLTWSVQKCRCRPLLDNCINVDFTRDVSIKLGTDTSPNVRCVLSTRITCRVRNVRICMRGVKKYVWLGFTSLNVLLQCRSQKVVILMRGASKSWRVALWIIAFLTSTIMP